MKKLCLLWGGMYLLAVFVFIVAGCRKKEAVSAPTAEENLQEEAVPKPAEAQDAKPKNVLETLRQVEPMVHSTELLPSNQVMITRHSQALVADDEADVVFPKKLGRFEMGFGGVPPRCMAIKEIKQRPYSLSYDSDELKSSACILVEPRPKDVTGTPMELEACQKRMVEFVNQFAMGRMPMLTQETASPPGADVDGKPAGVGGGMKGLKLDEPMPEGTLKESSLAYRRFSWRWRGVNGVMWDYQINDEGMHGAEMFWDQRRFYAQSLSYKHKAPMNNPSGEQLYTLTALLILKKNRLFTVIVQSEGSAALENHPSAVEEICAALDKNFLVSCSDYLSKLDEESLDSHWAEQGDGEVKLCAVSREAMPPELLATCISAEAMEGKSFNDICGVDYENKLAFSKLTPESRMADALQSLILYIRDYAALPPSLRQPLNVIFQGADGYVDADEVVKHFGEKAEAPQADAEKLAVKEKLLREKIAFRNRQVQFICKVMANNRARKLFAVGREIDAKRTARLESHIQQQLQTPTQPYNMNMQMNMQSALEPVQHFLDELKSGSVSPYLKVNNMGFQSFLYNLISRLGPTTHQKMALDFAKVLFDLGEDDLAMALLSNQGELDRENHLCYMLSNGLDLYGSNFGFDRHSHILNGLMQQSPRIVNLFLLANYPVPGNMMFNLISENRIDIVKRLLFADIPVNERCNGQLPLAMAIMKGNTELEQLLLANGANPELTDATGRKPEDYRMNGLYWNALVSKDHAKQKECLSKGILPENQFNGGMRYIDKALTMKDTEAVRLLLEYKFVPASWELLQRSYYSGLLDVFKLVLKQDIPLEQNGQHILNVVLQHSVNGQSDTAEYLKAVLARVPKEKLNQEICRIHQGNMPYNCTPACYTLYINNSGSDTSDVRTLEYLKILAEAGADISKMPSERSLSPLFYATFKGFMNIDIYSYLISKGADVNSVTVPKSLDMNNQWRMFSEIHVKGVEKTGMLTFMARMMVERQYYDSRFLSNVLPYLLEKGAKVDIKDSKGKSCLDYVETMKDKNKQMYEQWASRIRK